MKPYHKSSIFSFSSSTVTYTFHNDQTTPQSLPNSTFTPVPITVHLPQSDAATRIQSAYRAHIIRTLYKRISTVNSEADSLQNSIQRQETVDAIRSDEREKVRMNEALMGLLLRLDSVPGGIDPTVREARRKVSRRIVGLQEIVDGISWEARIEDNVWWGPDGMMMKSLDEVVGEMEEEVCRERGGEEMERFCAQHLGFRCLQRFLSEL